MLTLGKVHKLQPAGPEGASIGSKAQYDPDCQFLSSIQEGIFQVQHVMFLSCDGAMAVGSLVYSVAVSA